MRSSEGLQRYKINEMRALKGTDGPCFPVACNVCRSTSGFVCSTVAERLQHGYIPRIRLQRHSPLTSFYPWTLHFVPASGGSGLFPGPPAKLSLLLPLCHPWIWGLDLALNTSPLLVFYLIPLPHTTLEILVVSSLAS